jgi:hypothetical protein
MAGDPEADGAADDAADAAGPSFSIPAHPERRFPYDEGVRYEGSTLFRLTPGADREEAALDDLVGAVLAAGPYRYGDFFDLPMPVYLVRDDGTGDVFRVSVRDGRVRLHVLPETGPAGLRAFYERLTEHSGVDWQVDCRTDR